MQIILLCLAVLCAAAAVSLALFLSRRIKQEYRLLLWPAVPLFTVLLLRFGVEGVLFLFGTGWRCTPQNILDVLCLVFLIVELGCFIKVASELWMRSLVFAAICVVVFELMMYYPQVYWHDSIIVQDGQSVVLASNGHGSIGERRCFLPINDLVHGKELEYDWLSCSVKLPTCEKVGPD